MLTKAIASGKEHRTEYYGWQAVDKTTRNHGSDWWFRDNRLYNRNKTDQQSKQALKDFYQYS